MSLTKLSVLCLHLQEIPLIEVKNENCNHLRTNSNAQKLQLMDVDKEVQNSISWWKNMKIL
jgi:hypothetical protein